MYDLSTKPSLWERYRKDLGALALVLALTLLAICYYNGAWTPAAWGRAWYILEDIPLLAGYFKAAAEGQAYPFQIHLIERLNAPYQANWSDFPTTEELIYLYGGLLTRVFGVFAAYNLCILTAHWMAAVSFYCCARFWGAQRRWAALCAFAYACCRFSWVRDSIHINLAFFWHLPIYWVVARWLWEGRPLRRSHWIGVVAFTFVSSWQHPYYWFFWMVTLVPCIGGPLLRGQFRQAANGVILMGLSLFFLVLAQVDSFRGWAAYGKSPVPFLRTLNEQILYQLRLPEFFLPAKHHISRFADFAQEHYYTQLINWANESDSSYAGMLGILAIAWLVAESVRRVVSGPKPDFLAGMTLWLTLVSLGGGLNMCLASLGVLLFRCSCRFSILILAGLLLFLVLRLSSLKLPRRVSVLALSLGFPLVFFDQIPPPLPIKYHRTVESIVANDQATIDHLEQRLSDGAMVFQWPVTPYPEAPMFRKLAHYEEFVAYLLSSKLHLSYGDFRGRDESRWQYQLIGKPPEDILKSLERYGFQAAIVYPGGLTEWDQLLWVAARGGPDWKSPNGDRWVYNLRAAVRPVRPEVESYYTLKDGFEAIENDGRRFWRWSGEKATIELQVSATPATIVEFSLVSYARPRTVTVYLDGKSIWSGVATTGADNLLPVRLEIPPGKHTLDLIGGGPIPPRNEGRLLMFQVIDLTMTPSIKPQEARPTGQEADDVAYPFGYIPSPLVPDREVELIRGVGF